MVLGLGSGFFGKLPNYYNEIWKAIIRPPRDVYDLQELGPSRFSLRGRHYKREDFGIKNSRGQNLECSHFEPEKRVIDKLPCVIYLHGNASSRLEGLSIISSLLPLNIGVVTIDLSGSGHSGGEFVTLGWQEKDDVTELIHYLREQRKICTIALWGRSMGAVTALFHAKDSSISGIVCDSAFYNLRKLSEELATEQLAITMPKVLVGTALNFLRNTILTKTKGFDINKLDLTKATENAKAPIIFIASEKDAFINPNHSQVLYAKCNSDRKWLELVEGDHNSIRDDFVNSTIVHFLWDALGCEELFKSANSTAVLDAAHQFLKKLGPFRETIRKNHSSSSSSSSASTVASQSVIAAATAPPIGGDSPENLLTAKSSSISSAVEQPDATDSAAASTSLLHLKMQPPERSSVNLAAVTDDENGTTTSKTSS